MSAAPPITAVDAVDEAASDIADDVLPLAAEPRLLLPPPPRKCFIEDEELLYMLLPTVRILFIHGCLSDG